MAITLTPFSKAFLTLSVGGSLIMLGGPAMQKKLLALPQLQVVDKVNPNQTTIRKASEIHLIREDASGHAATSSSDLDAATTNRLFSGTPAKTGVTTTPDAAPKAIDYFGQLVSGGHIRVDAITDNGAIINGEFVPVGGFIDEFEYPAPGQDENNPKKTLRPRLASVAAGSIVVNESIAPHRSLKISVD